MKSSTAGKNTLKAEVTHISVRGVWLLFNKKEYFLPFSEYPWLKDTKISEIQNIKTLHNTHLYWPDLDVDLSKNILEDLDFYPLTWK